jgi:acyl carrier protein
MTISSDDVFRDVARIAAEVAHADARDVTPKTHFRADLNYDSLENVEFIMQIEDHFEIAVPDDAATQVQTVGQAVDLVCRATAARVPRA